MKRLTYLCLIGMFAAANALVFVGCGCDDDDDDVADDGGADASETAKDSGNSETKDSGSGESDSGVVDANEQTADSGIGGGDATVDTGTVVEYACGGDNAECDLLNETSCGEGKGCQFLTPASGEGAPVAQCVDIGAGEAGDECDDKNPCGAGYECNAGFCHKYCCTLGSTDECPTNQICIIDIVDQSDQSTGVLLCDECDECNPLTADGCGEDLGCYPIPSADTDTGCRLCLESKGNKEAGDACDAANDCKPGIGCYRINDEDPICTNFCDLEADSDPCAPDGECKADDDMIGEASLDDTVGLCIPK